MAEVKWIKLVTDIFDNRKIRQIEKMPEGDSIIVIWVKLLCLAGNINDGGFIYFTGEIPYTEEMLAVEFNRPLQTVKLALATFQRFGMIEIIDDIYKISSWEKYQNVDGLDRIREQTRKRVAEHRQRKKIECNVTCNATVTHGNAIEEEKEKELEKENKEIECGASAQEIVEMYNAICKSYPKVTKLSDMRRRVINARMKMYSADDFRKLFEKAEASAFLKGGNDRGWTATFDWLIKDSNIAKVLDGNYDAPAKKKSKNSFDNFESRQNDVNEMELLFMQNQ